VGDARYEGDLRATQQGGRIVKGTVWPNLVEVIGVYDASSSVLGELVYWLKARVFGDHCVLCRVTHTEKGPRDEWVTCQQRLPAPFVTYHRNDQPDDVRALGGTNLPTILARTSEGVREVLDRDAIEECAGSPSALADAIMVRLVQLTS